MKEEKMQRNCRNCRYYKEFYMKGYIKFSKAKQGYCNRRKKIIEKLENCEMWQTDEGIGALRKDNILIILERMANQIGEMAQILKEGQEKES